MLVVVNRGLVVDTRDAGVVNRVQGYVLPASDVSCIPPGSRSSGTVIYLYVNCIARLGCPVSASWRIRALHLAPPQRRSSENGEAWFDRTGRSDSKRSSCAL